MKESKIKEEEHRVEGEKCKVRCNYCRKEVEVALIQYGEGWVATCPACDKLAYNSIEKPDSASE